MGHRFIRPSGELEHRGKIVVRRSVVGIDLQRGVKILDGRVAATL